MSDHKHTPSPGPWVSPWDLPEDTPDEAHAFYDANGNYVCAVDWIDGPQLMVSRPNARLMAAAPALRDTARDMLAFIKTLPEDAMGHVNGPDGEPMYPLLHEHIAAWERSLALADGQEEA